MKLKVQKRLAAQILKASKKRIVFDTEYLDQIRESITKSDIRGLINDKIISKSQKKGISRKTTKSQNEGSRKGKFGARNPKKRTWMNAIRLQRALLKKLRDNELISTKTYQGVYMKAKGGFFRSKRHLKLYMDDNNLIIKKQ